MGAPLVVLVEKTGPLAALRPAELAELGVSLAIYPGTVRYAVAWAAQQAPRALREDGTSAAVRGVMVTAAEWNALLGLDEALAVERRFHPRPHR